MPKFVIERRYLVPMYQHIVVEAENLEMACEMAVSDDIDWDTQEMDCDSARATTITESKVIPKGYDLDHFQRVLITSRDRQNLPLDTLTLATFLYEDAMAMCCQCNSAGAFDVNGAIGLSSRLGQDSD
jgi:hypothetical protein